MTIPNINDSTRQHIVLSGTLSTRQINYDLNYLRNYFVHILIQEG